ncbi:MAG: crossover junction endodeoxyribonuclease RuvC [Thermoanaerobaculia bacterium]|nr:crossover junction endodeoxyribonuclease RuvC [Thermoanaerobaculia bacterium]
MVILGLDPGSRHTGYGVVEERGDRLVALDFGRISAGRGSDLPQRLAHLSRELTALLERHRPQATALETAFHGVNSRSLIVLAQARGALLATVAGHTAEVREYSPAQVKSAVSGNGRADKRQVERMVRLILDLPGARLSADAADALAVAICCSRRLAFERLAETAD